VRAKAIWRAPRRAAARVLRGVQGQPLYRRIGRRLAPHFTIVEATKADMAAVWRRLAPNVPIGALPEHPDATRWVARWRGKVVGHVQLVDHPEEDAPWVGCWLDSLEVWGLCRGFGLGDALARRVIAAALSNGAAEILLVVRSDNTPALSLYRRLGFEFTTVASLTPLLVAGRRASGRRHVVMRKVLDRASASPSEADGAA
jgi:GNAT superfamily N-acetyltransferase